MKRQRTELPSRFQLQLSELSLEPLRNLDAEAVSEIWRFADISNEHHIQEVAQELRSVLTSLSGASSRLLESQPDESTLSLHAGVEYLKRFTISLNELTLDRQLTLKKVRLDELIKKAFDEVLEYYPNIKGSGIQLCLSTANIIVQVSAQHLLRLFVHVIQHIIDNSEKELAERKELEVSVSRTKDLTRIIINGTSCKLSQDIDSYIEESMELSRNSLVNLVIANDIVAAHGGNFFASTDSANSHVFVIELPRATSAASTE